VQARRGKFAEAEATLKKAVAVDTKSPAANIQLGEMYLTGLKNPKSAEAAYQEALRSAPENLDAQLGLAASLAMQRRDDEAVSAFEKAASMGPGDGRGLLSLSRFYASRGQFDKALGTLDRTLAAFPDLPAAHLDRGDLLLAKGDLEKAAASFAASAEVLKQPAMAQFRLGVTFEALRRWDDAERAYLNATKSDPKMFAAYNNLAYMSADRRARLDEALTWARKAIELAPKNLTLQDTLGWVYRARGELEPAAVAIRKALASDAKQPNFHYHLGVVYEDQGKTREAVASLQKALELNANFRNSRDARARLTRLAQK
jgi:tetratricopeptide (TPR) repeat protein